MTYPFIQQDGVGSGEVGTNIMFADEADSWEAEKDGKRNKNQTATSLESGHLQQLQITHHDNRTKYAEESDVLTSKRKQVEMVARPTNRAEIFSSGLITSTLRNISSQDGYRSHRLKQAEEGGTWVGPWQDGEINNNHGLGWQDVAGGAVAGIVLVVLLVGLLIWLRLRRDKVEDEVEGGAVDLDSVSLDNKDLNVVLGSFSLDHEDLRVVASVLSAFNADIRKADASRTQMENALAELQKKPPGGPRDYMKTAQDEPTRTLPSDLALKIVVDSFTSPTMTCDPREAKDISRESDRFNCISKKIFLKISQ